MGKAFEETNGYITLEVMKSEKPGTEELVDALFEIHKNDFCNFCEEMKSDEVNRFIECLMIVCGQDLFPKGWDMDCDETKEAFKRHIGFIKE